MMCKLNVFLRDESGASAVEYALIAAGVSMVIISSINSIGAQVKGMFQNVSTQLATAGH